MNAILIDDEPDSLRLLALQLAQYCPQVQVLGQTTSSEEGLKLLKKLEPDLLFLDIEMPRMNGFQLLEQLEEIPAGLVFVTAYDAFALKAFRFSALDYLLKPVDSEELKAAVRKAERRLRPGARPLDLLRSQLAGTAPSKLAVPHQNGMVFVELKEILYAESDSNYTKLVLTDGRHYLLTKTLRDVQDVLEERNFLRVHRQYLVNLDHIQRYVKGEGNYLVLTNGASIPVARQQKDWLMERFGWV
ncbi:MAG: LytTR family DNA-binding domain-containing protein [Cytophagaceae bacterium]|nr:LytTR family DNA-binding domain-containing protein [Cytophagaceae bacterium]